MKPISFDISFSLCIGISLALLTIGSEVVRRDDWQLSRNFSRTTAEIKNAICGSTNWRLGSGNTTTFYSPQVVYVYTVGDSVFRGVNYSSYNNYGLRSLKECEELLVNLKTSNYVDVWYEKNSPANAYLNIESPNPFLELFFGGGALIFLILGIRRQCFLNRRRKRNQLGKA